MTSEKIVIKQKNCEYCHVWELEDAPFEDCGIPLQLGREYGDLDAIEWLDNLTYITRLNSKVKEIYTISASVGPVSINYCPMCGRKLNDE